MYPLSEFFKFMGCWTPQDIVSILDFPFFFTEVTGGVLFEVEPMKNFICGAKPTDICFTPSENKTGFGVIASSTASQLIMYNFYLERYLLLWSKYLMNQHPSVSVMAFFTCTITIKLSTQHFHIWDGSHGFRFTLYTIHWWGSYFFMLPHITFIWYIWDSSLKWNELFWCPYTCTKWNFIVMFMMTHRASMTILDFLACNTVSTNVLVVVDPTFILSRLILHIPPNKKLTSVRTTLLNLIQFTFIYSSYKYNQIHVGNSMYTYRYPNIPSQT